MGVWQVPSDLVARSRFTVSPMVETVAALKALRHPHVPWEQAWRRPHVEAFRRMLAARPAARALLSASFNLRWIADFLTIAPTSADPTFATELAAVERLSDERIRADLRATHPGPLAAELRADGLTGQVVELLQWVWTHTVEPEWPEREGRLRADIVARTAALSTSGWAGVLADINRNVRWLGDGRLQVNDYPEPPLSLDQAEQLVFLPAHCRRGWVVWDLPTRFGMVYPARGILVDPTSPAPDGLARLIGVNRADILARLDAPLSTSQLVVVTGLSLGTVSDHLRVLLDAGAVSKRRSGREVLYWRTPLGAALVDGG
ncbi:transcriptional regulator [Micromonospora fulviviridis]|uniref:ArsR/SmtB family transcription factor n=1 Tax=Micromonospora fulviviridis TaxID=47860 RepID=UPI001662AB02|nr:helix-turn-helix domain-containing protein [Micromonospora fulviviridis]GGS11484.1 transcriptional regulator [Micromonospora fulviviridis]